VTDRVGLAAVFAASAWIACFGAACRRQQTAPPSPAVATYAGGAVTAADVDQAVLDLPPQRRQPEDGDFLAWYERLAREIAVQRLLLAEARQAGLELDPELPRARADVRKQATVEVFLEKDVARPERPSEAELRAFYDAHRADFQVAHARLTRHIFRRVGGGADPRPVRAAVERLRARAIAGEDFSVLAAEHSESESRHQKGILGWVTPGQLAPELDRIIFALKVGVPSEPIRTREGVHLFLVSQERPKTAYSFPEVRPLILQRILGERWDANLRGRVGDRLPEGSFVPDGDELRQILAGGDPQALVAQIGDFKLSLGEFQKRLAAVGALDPSLRSASPLTFLAHIRQREIVYRHCLENGLDRRPEVEARQRRLMERELVALMLRRKLVQSLDRDPERLEEYYRTNRARFSEPLQLRVQKLVVPLAGGANEAMARLERSAADLDQGGQTLASLAAALGGRVEDPAWTTPSQLARTDPRAAPFVLRLRPGQHSAPYRTETDLVLVRLIERREPQPLPFERARERVQADFLATHRHDRYAALSSDLLGRAGFKVLRPSLEELLRRPGAEG
jgi:parvulin-like peptidyl-prolyl isomerase